MSNSTLPNPRAMNLMSNLTLPNPRAMNSIYEDDFADITGPSGRKIPTWEKWAKLSDGASLKYSNYEYVKGKAGDELKLLQSIRKQQVYKKGQGLQPKKKETAKESPFDISKFLFFSLHFLRQN